LRLAILNSIRAYGGGEKWVLRAAAGFTGRGCEVRVLGDPEGRLGDRCAAAGQSFVPVRLNDCSLLAAARALRGELRQYPADALIACNERSVRVAAMAKAIDRGKLRSLPLVYRNGLEGSFKNKALNRLLVGGRVARYVVNAEATRRELLGFGWISPDRVQVIYNGVEPPAANAAHRLEARAELGADPGDVVALAAARLVVEKGHELLLRALAHLPAARSPRLWIAGEGPEKDHLDRLIAELGLTGRVRLLGFRSDVARLLGAADFLCHPSRREGAPNIVLEAMSAGLPVVGLAASGTVELVEDGRTGLLSSVGDPRALAANIERVTTDVELRRSLGEAGRARAVAEFTEERSTDHWMELLEEVVAGKSGAARAGGG
jgi:glycosyltransferase involved in cell wall biosynthesis